MASISNVRLSIFDVPGSSGLAGIQVGFTVTETNDDAVSERSYREVVELVGVDEGPGEDGQSDVIVGVQLEEGLVTFTTSQTSFVRGREKQVSSALLEEDGMFRRAEIRARVTLIPVPPRTVTRESNTVLRSRPIAPPSA